jgi:hypothetical protein
MNPGRVAYFFRQCAGSLTSQHLARTAVNYPHRHVVAGRRYYSDDTKQSEEKVEEGSTNGKSQTVDQVSELKEKLMKKEEEAVDLLVRVVVWTAVTVVFIYLFIPTSSTPHHTGSTTISAG